MTSARAIVAGAAFIKMTMDDAELKRGLDSAHGKLKQFSDDVKSWSNSMVNIGAVLAYPIADATKKFADFDDQMRLTAAITGATGKQFESLRQLALKLGRETSFSTSQVAAGMVALGRMGFSPKEIEMAIKHVMNLSRTTNAELSVAAEIAGNALRALGLDTSHTAEVVDILMTTANGSAQTLTDLGEALKYAAPAARTAGESIYDVNKALGVLANVGIRGSIAGNALKRAYSELAKPEVQEYLKKFNVNVVDGNGNLRKFADILRDCAAAMATMGSAEKLNFATQVFGERAAPAALAITVDMSKIDEFLAKLDKASGSAEKVAAEMEAGIGGKLRIMMSSLEGVAIALGEIVAVTFGPFIEELSNVALVIREILGNNNELVSGILQLTGTMIGLGVGVKAFTLLKSGISALFLPIMAADKALAALIAKKIAASGASNALAASEIVLANSYKMVHSHSLLAAAGQKIATAATLTFKGALDLLCAHPVIAALAAITVAIYAVNRATQKAAAEAEKEARVRLRITEQYREEREALEQKIAAEEKGIQRLMELEKLNSLTNEQQTEAKSIIDSLTRAYGNFGIEIDSVTGKITGATAAYSKLKAEQKEALHDKMFQEADEAQKSANALRNSLLKEFGFFSKMGSVFDSKKLELLVEMGYEKKRGKYNLIDNVGYADIDHMKDALIYAQDNGLDDEATKIKEIISLLERKQNLLDQINDTGNKSKSRTEGHQFGYVKLPTEKEVADTENALRKIQRSRDTYSPGYENKYSKFYDEIDKIDDLKTKYQELMRVRKEQIELKIKDLDIKKMPHMFKQNQTEEDLETIRKINDEIVSLRANIKDLEQTESHVITEMDRRREYFEAEIANAKYDEDAEKKKTEKEAESKKINDHVKYGNFLNDFYNNQRNEEREKERDEKFAEYLKDFSDEGYKWLREFVQSFEKVVEDKENEYKKTLEKYMSEDSSDGDSLSDSEKAELDRIQEEYKKLHEKLKMYQEKIESRSDHTKKDAINLIDNSSENGMTFSSFDSAAFAGFLFSAKSQKDYNSELTAKATTRSEQHLRDILSKVGKGTPIK